MDLKTCKNHEMFKYLKVKHFTVHLGMHNAKTSTT